MVIFSLNKENDSFVMKKRQRILIKSSFLRKYFILSSNIFYLTKYTE